jgi:hypothetical protein
VHLAGSRVERVVPAADVVLDISEGADRLP